MNNAIYQGKVVLNSLKSPLFKGKKNFKIGAYLITFLMILLSEVFIPCHRNFSCKQVPQSLNGALLLIFVSGFAKLIQKLSSWLEKGMVMKICQRGPCMAGTIDFKKKLKSEGCEIKNKDNAHFFFRL